MLQVYDVCDRFKNEKIPPNEVETICVLILRTSPNSILRILRILLFPQDGGRIVILTRCVAITGFFTSSRNSREISIIVLPTLASKN